MTRLGFQNELKGIRGKNPEGQGTSGRGGEIRHQAPSAPVMLPGQPPTDMVSSYSLLLEGQTRERIKKTLNGVKHCLDVSGEFEKGQVRSEHSTGEGRARRVPPWGRWQVRAVVPEKDRKGRGPARGTGRARSRPALCLTEGSESVF